MGILLNKSKNYIINGAMDYWQRGTSFAAIAANTYSVDRLQYIKTGTAVHTLTRDTDIPTQAQSGFSFSASVRLSLTTAQPTLAVGDGIGFLFRHEGGVVSPLYGKNITFSFWVKATRVGIYPIAFRSSDNTRSYVTTYTVNTTETWERKSVTLLLDTSSGAWPSDSSAGLFINMNIAAGTGANASSLNTWLSGQFSSHSSCVNGVQAGSTNFRITGVQLEEGVSASNFERAGGNIVNELQLCQRYYETCPFTGLGPGRDIYHNTQYKVTKRATPLLSWNNINGSTAGFTISPLQASGVSGFRQNTLAASDFDGTVFADAEL